MADLVLTGGGGDGDAEQSYLQVSEALSPKIPQGRRTRAALEDTELAEQLRIRAETVAESGRRPSGAAS